MALLYGLGGPAFGLTKRSKSFTDTKIARMPKYQFRVTYCHTPLELPEKSHTMKGI